MVLTPIFFMCATSACDITRVDCGMLYDHGDFVTETSIGAKVMCGVPVSDATAATALAVGVAALPISMSTLSSVTKRRAFLAALVGSVASSRMMTFNFSPAML